MLQTELAFNNLANRDEGAGVVKLHEGRSSLADIQLERRQAHPPPHEPQRLEEAEYQEYREAREVEVSLNVRLLPEAPRLAEGRALRHLHALHLRVRWTPTSSFPSSNRLVRKSARSNMKPRSVTFRPGGQWWRISCSAGLKTI